MITREITAELLRCAGEYPVVTVLGPRQSGKTTLAKMTFPGKPYVSLEDPDMRELAMVDPRGFLKRFPAGAILDEIQRAPDLLSYIQGLVDQRKQPGQFILTGSHQPLLHQAVSQSLAGRTAILTLLPFSFPELRHYQTPLQPYATIVAGGYPRLHEERLELRRFFNSYVQTYVERDVRSLIQLRELSQFQKFLTLLAGRIGQVVNLASLGNDVGVSGGTIRQWLSVLAACYIVFQLPPFFENIGKRLIKSPKIYFTDTGLAAFLLGIHTPEQAARDPLRGNLFENCVIAEIAKGMYNRGGRPEMYFYRDSHGHEVDLLIREGGRLVPVEIKSAETFNEGFLKGLRRFRELGLHQTVPGVLLYGGEQRLTVRDTLLANPFDMDDLWEVITSSAVNAKID